MSTCDSLTYADEKSLMGADLLITQSSVSVELSGEEAFVTLQWLAAAHR